jgi:polysaccharide biosynthesis protein PslH
MKLLFVTPRFPYPPLKGDQVVSYHRLRTLSQRHEVTLLTFYQNSEELENIKHIKTYCQNIHTVKIPKWQSFFNLAKGVFSYLPLQVSYYYSDAFRNKVNQILSTNNFDAIHLFLLRVAPYFKDISTPKVIELIDSMQLNLERRIALESFPVRNILQEELRRIIIYEQNLHKSFEKIVVVSEKDAKLIPGQNVQIIPNGIDTELFRQQQQSPLNPTLIFSGNMSYAPNIHAVKWFVEHCLPIIQQTIPDVSFVIAGANPSKEVQSLGQTKGVKVTGFVKSMSDTLRSANIGVAPMQSGSGIQNKILEAMSTGLPVVTTNLGLGSIKAKPNNEILVADTPEDFAQKTIYLLQNPLKAKEIGHQARKYVVDNHSWDFAANEVEQLYHQILNR